MFLYLFVKQHIKSYLLKPLTESKVSLFVLKYFYYKEGSQNSKHCWEVNAGKANMRRKYLKIYLLKMKRLRITWYQVQLVYLQSNITMEKNNNSTLPKQFHQCRDFTHNGSTNRGISPVQSHQSFPQSNTVWGPIQYQQSSLHLLWNMAT